RDLPEYEYFVHIPSIRFGHRVTQNFNKLIGRYPGADGFKTGFICASGYNLIGSATRNGRRLIAVVLGASSGLMRAVRAAQLLDRGFAGTNLSWLQPSLGNVENLTPIDASPPDLHEQMCGPHRKRPASDEDEDTVANNAGASGTGASGVTFFAAGLQPPTPNPSELLAGPAAASEPIPVYTGPTRTGAALIAAIAADTAAQTSRPHGKHSHHATKKPDAVADARDAKDTSKNTRSDAAKNTGAKPVRHANAKPDASPKSTDQAAAKPAKPKAAAKRGAKPASKNTNG
ncbi:MAG: D-alanyl-D-alanine carboxypeptidase, partial [Bradyrhizobium sp.]|nr:D-alanyl-D-alanine carboxypeptidase [Bradyrhizobium sp.]